MANTSLDISPTSAQPIAYTMDVSEPTSSQSKQDIKMEVELLKPKPEPAQNVPCLLLVDKYRPTCVREIIGAARDTSPASKLMRWLRDWFSVNRGGGVKQGKPASKGESRIAMMHRTCVMIGQIKFMDNTELILMRPCSLVYYDMTYI